MATDSSFLLLVILLRWLILPPPTAAIPKHFRMYGQRLHHPHPLPAHGKLKGQIGAGITEKFHVWSDLGDDDDTPGATGLLSAYTMDGALFLSLLLLPIDMLGVAAQSC